MRSSIGMPPLETLGRPKLLVVGDLMLDEYVWGEVSRVSPEAPVPVLAGRLSEYKTGGAGSVVENLFVLGADVRICGLAGKDEAGERLLELLEKRSIAGSGVVVSTERPTTRKSRMMAYVQHANRAQQQILRVDWERIMPPTDDERARLVRVLDDEFASPPQAVLVSDYEKGVLDPRLLAHIFALAKQAGVPVLVDPGRSVDYSCYRGATLLCPNRYESQHATGVQMVDPQHYAEAGGRLVRNLGLRYAVLTLDREGIFLVRRAGVDGEDLTSRAFPTMARAVTDVAGAGDMVLSLLGLALAAGWGIEHAIELANIGAGIEVSKVGVTPVEMWELERAIETTSNAAQTKLLGVRELGRIVARARAARRKIVFTNGCFDMLHPGHVALLEKARALGDQLVVGLNSDESVRHNKGPGRPVLSAEERAAMLSAMSCVDFVVVFDQDTPEELIELIRPDVLVKGDDYRNREIAGRLFVESYGGRVMLIPLEPNQSSTALLERIRGSGGIRK